MLIAGAPFGSVTATLNNLHTNPLPTPIRSPSCRTVRTRSRPSAPPRSFAPPHAQPRSFSSRCCRRATPPSRVDHDGAIPSPRRILPLFFGRQPHPDELAVSLCVVPGHNRHRQPGTFIGARVGSCNALVRLLSDLRLPDPKASGDGHLVGGLFIVAALAVEPNSFLNESLISAMPQGTGMWRCRTQARESRT